MTNTHDSWPCLTLRDKSDKVQEMFELLIGKERTCFMLSASTLNVQWKTKIHGRCSLCISAFCVILCPWMCCEWQSLRSYTVMLLPLSVWLLPQGVVDFFPQRVHRNLLMLWRRKDRKHIKIVLLSPVGDIEFDGLKKIYLCLKHPAHTHSGFSILCMPQMAVIIGTD